MKKKIDLGFVVPYGTCDTHHHVFNPKQFKSTPCAIVPYVNWTDDHPEHPVEEYRKLCHSVGITHNILVATTAYGYNWECDLDALSKFGTATTRSILWLSKEITDEQLEEFHKKGVRGSRAFVFSNETTADCLNLAPRFAKLGWILDFTLLNEQDTYKLIDLLPQLPCEVVIAHQAGIKSLDDPLLPIIKKLLQEKRIWVKISGIFRDSPAPDYAASVAVSRELVAAAPDRIIWASDWPFNWSDLSTEDGLEKLMRVIPNQIEDESLIEQILAKNPAKLYGFDLYDK